jgi:hypothetical protein
MEGCVEPRASPANQKWWRSPKTRRPASLQQEELEWSDPVTFARLLKVRKVMSGAAFSMCPGRPNWPETAIERLSSADIAFLTVNRASLRA